MGFNKRFVDYQTSMVALKNGDLKSYYGKSDALIFEDEMSSVIYSLYKKGVSNEEIINLIKSNTEEKTNEVYQSNQRN